MALQGDSDIYSRQQENGQKGTEDVQRHLHRRDSKDPPVEENYGVLRQAKSDSVQQRDGIDTFQECLQLLKIEMLAIVTDINGW